MAVFSGLLMFYMVFLLLLVAAAMVYSIVNYAMTSKSMYEIAKRRGIDRPWLAWVPVANSWMLGCISDQYRYVVHGQERNRRQLMMWLHISMTISLFFYILVVIMYAGVSVTTVIDSYADGITTAQMGGSVLVSLFQLVFMGANAVHTVFSNICCYDLYRSCDPKKSLVYLLVGIFAVYPLPFFVYACRDKDLGMPPTTVSASKYANCTSVGQEAAGIFQ